MRKAGEVCYGAAHGDVGKNKGVVCYDRKEVSFHPNNYWKIIYNDEAELLILIVI